MDTTQAIAAATLLMAFSGLVVAYVNMQTSRLSALVAALQVINDSQAFQISGLQQEVSELRGRIDILQEENLRLLAQLVTHLSSKEQP